MPFQDGNGIQYQFPLKDVASLVLTRRKPASLAAGATDSAKVIPEGTAITVRAGETIDSAKSSSGQLYLATVSEDVPDTSGGIAIRAGTPAKLLVLDIGTGGATHSPERVCWISIRLSRTVKSIERSRPMWM